MLAMPNGVHRFSRQFEGGGDFEQPGGGQDGWESCAGQLTAELEGIVPGCDDGNGNGGSAVGGGEDPDAGAVSRLGPGPEFALLAECVRAYEGLQGDGRRFASFTPGSSAESSARPIRAWIWRRWDPISNAHSPQEQVEIASVDACWELLTTLLERL
jgi:hypothetical protein